MKKTRNEGNELLVSISGQKFFIGKNAARTGHAGVIREEKKFGIHDLFHYFHEGMQIPEDVNRLKMANVLSRSVEIFILRRSLRSRVRTAELSELIFSASED